MGTVTIHPTAIIETGAVIGEGTTIWHFAHVRSTAIIGRDCTLGKDVYVDQGVTIGHAVKIQNGVSLYQGVRLGNDVFVGPHVAFTNDLYPRSFGAWTPVPTHVRNGASIGANATILCGITIGLFAMVAAGSVVTDDVPDHALVMGNPARIVGYVDMFGHPAPESVRHA